MTSFMTRAATLFLCWMMVAKFVDAENFPEKIQRFLSIYTGNYDNDDRRIDVVASDFIQVRVQLVSAPALKAPVLYIEESINGRAVIILVCEVAEIPGQDAVKLTTYKVTDPSRYEAYGFDVNTLANYTLKDFQVYEDCPYDLYWRPGGKYYTGLWTDCMNVVDGKSTKYAVTVDCWELVFVTTLAEFNIATDVPYVLDRLDTSHIKPNPCGDKR